VFRMFSALAEFERSLIRERHPRRTFAVVATQVRRCREDLIEAKAPCSEIVVMFLCKGGSRA
jgi:hypothetical protein